MCDDGDSTIAVIDLDQRTVIHDNTSSSNPECPLPISPPNSYYLLPLTTTTIKFPDQTCPRRPQQSLVWCNLYKCFTRPYRNNRRVLTNECSNWKHFWKRNGVSDKTFNARSNWRCLDWTTLWWNTRDIGRPLLPPCQQPPHPRCPPSHSPHQNKASKTGMANNQQTGPNGWGALNHWRPASKPNQDRGTTCSNQSTTPIKKWMSWKNQYRLRLTNTLSLDNNWKRRSMKHLLTWQDWHGKGTYDIMFAYVLVIGTIYICIRYPFYSSTSWSNPSLFLYIYIYFLYCYSPPPFTS